MKNLPCFHENVQSLFVYQTDESEIKKPNEKVLAPNGGEMETDLTTVGTNAELSNLEVKDEEKKAEAPEINDETANLAEQVEQGEEKKEIVEIKKYLEEIKERALKTEGISDKAKNNILLVFDNIELGFDKARSLRTEKGKREALMKVLLEEFDNLIGALEREDEKNKKENKQPSNEKLIESFYNAKQKVLELAKQSEKKEKKTSPFDQVSQKTYTDEEIAELSGVPLLQAIGSPKLIRILQHGNIDKNDLIKGMQGLETDQEKRDYLKKTIKGIIKRELVEWMESQLPTVRKLKAKKAQKETKAELGEVNKVGAIMGNTMGMVKGFFGSSAIGGFLEGSVLLMVFPPTAAAKFTEKMIAEGDEFVYSNEARIEINGKEQSVDKYIETRIDDIVTDKLNLKALEKTGRSLQITTSENKEDLQYALKKMETVPKEYFGDPFEKKYKTYVVSKGAYALDFPEWLDQQNIPFLTRMKFLFKRLWMDFKEMLPQDEKDKEKSKSEIQKELQVLLDEAPKELTPDQSEEMNAGVTELEKQYNEATKIYEEESKEKKGANPTIEIKDFKKDLEIIRKKDDESSLEKIRTLLIMFQEKGKETLFGVALTKNLNIKNLLKIHEHKDKFKIDGEKLYFKKNDKENVPVEWTNNAISVLVTKSIGTVSEQMKALEHTQTDLEINIDGEDISLREYLDSFKSADLKPEDISGAQKKELYELLHGSQEARGFLDQINKTEIKKQISGTEFWGGSGALPFSVLKKVANAGKKVEIALNDGDSEVNVNNDADETTWGNPFGFFGGSGDLKVRVNGAEWIDFDTFEQLEKLL